jgi:hypothetical protein
VVGCLEPVALAGAVDGVAHITAREHETEDDEFHEEPGPATATAAPAVLLLARGAGRRLTGLGGGRALARVALVQVLRLDGDDVEVIAELARLGAEAEVGHGGHFEVRELEAEGVFVLGLVLQLELEELVGEVGEAHLGGDLGVADAAGLDGLG